MRNASFGGTDQCSISMLGVVALLVRWAKRAIMPAVLSGVAVVLSVTSATLSSSSAKSLISVASFARFFSSTCVAIIRRVPVRGRHMIVAAVITCGARRVTISAVSSSLSSTVDSTGVLRFHVRCRIQRALVTACIIFTSRTFIFSRNLTRICMAW